MTIMDYYFLGFNYLSSSSFFSAFIFELISVVFLHITNTTKNNSYAILTPIFPKTSINMNPKKLDPIKANEDNVMNKANIK